MKGSVRRVILIAFGLALLARAPEARADASDAPTADAIAQAKVHFARGKQLYQAGSYREAIVELDAARALDPKAKDLVFNLAIVHEKLGEIDEALRYARLYAGMDLDAAERTRAESYIKRLEGAKAEVLAAHPPPPPPPTTAAPVERRRGRLDTATIAVAAAAVGAAGVGLVLGIKALADQPGNFVTGENGATVSSEESQQEKAHKEAIGSDVCFGIAGAAAAGAAVLYFARFRDAPPPPAPASPQAASRPVLTALRVSPLVGPGAGGLMLAGTF